MYYTKNFFILAALCCVLPITVLAHSDAGHNPKIKPLNKEQKDWGIAGDSHTSVRTIAVGMGDNMRFKPSKITVKLGETIKFSIKNNGHMLHEFVIGTKKELDAHAALMLKFPNMEHSEPYMVHVAPGKTEHIVWTFNKAGDFEFACLIAGHYQAGMVGHITVLSPK